MRKFKYLPELEVELSNHVSAPIKAKNRSNTVSYNEKYSTFDVDTENKNAKFFRIAGMVAPKEISIEKRSWYHSPKEVDIHVMPDAEISEAIFKRNGYSTVIPTVVPPVYNNSSAKEVAQYINDNHFNYQYGSSKEIEGYMVNRHVKRKTSVRGRDTTAFMLANSELQSYYAVGVSSPLEMQKMILHAIVLSVFLQKAEKSSNMSLGFDTFIKDKKNIRDIKNNFSTFTLAHSEHVETLAKYLHDGYDSMYHPIKYKTLNKESRRESLRNLRADALVNMIHAGVGKTPPFDTNNSRNKYIVEIRPTTYDSEVLISDYFRYVGNYKKHKVSKFHVNNVDNKIKKIFKEKVLYTQNALDELRKEDKEVKEKYYTYREETEKLANRTLYLGVRNRPHFAAMLNAFGEDYVKNHMRFTDLVMLTNFFNKPTNILKSSAYLNNTVVMVADNLKNYSGEDENGVREYILDMLYYTMLEKSKVVVHKNMASVDLSDMTNNYSDDDFPPALVGNVLFTDFVLSDKDKFENQELVKLLRKKGL